MMPPAVREKFDSFIRSKGLRQTGQRDSIVEFIFESDDHFTPDELFDRMSRAGMKPSRATLYRTLALLCEANLLHEIDLGDGKTTYDPNFLDRPSHNHLVCVDCGKVTEFEDDHIEVLHKCVSLRLGFRPVKQSLRIEAACEQLRAKGHCPNLIQARIEGKRLPNRKK
ncbi:MAG: transcriptional repressor [Verrucomicrobiota bacterium JB023]|nr:transcriptional repressor [Verrucomicrobiota bacterium JB023]